MHSTRAGSNIRVLSKRDSLALRLRKTRGLVEPGSDCVTEKPGFHSRSTAGIDRGLFHNTAVENIEPAMHAPSQSQRGRLGAWPTRFALLLLVQLLPACGLAAQFDVLTYNVYLRPFFHDGQDIRARLLINKLSGYDAIVLQEAYADPAREMLRAGLRSRYPFHTRVLGKDSGLNQDGGVLILSKWPLTRKRQLVFTDDSRSANRCPGRDCCAGGDCYADKGVVYGRIDKAGRRFHLFGAHLQSGREHWRIRKDQLRVIGNFIISQHIRADEPVIIAGDMNVDRFDARQFAAMRSLLAADLRPLKPASPTMPRADYTFDGPRNDLNDNDDVRRYVDYVLYSTAHLQPCRAFNRVRIFRAGQSWRQYFWQPWRRDLSDHYAVHGRFVYPRRPPRPAPAGNQSMTPELCAVSTGMERVGEAGRRARAVTLPR